MILSPGAFGAGRGLGCRLPGLFPNPPPHLCTSERNSLQPLPNTGNLTPSSAPLPQHTALPCLYQTCKTPAFLLNLPAPRSFPSWSWLSPATPVQILPTPTLKSPCASQPTCQTHRAQPHKSRTEDPALQLPKGPAGAEPLGVPGMISHVPSHPVRALGGSCSRQHFNASSAAPA